MVQAGGRVSDHIRALRARIGFIFQQFNLVGRLSLYSNVALGLLGREPAWRGVLGLWPKAEAQGVMAALQRMGVADYAGQKASTLSGGQQQRGAIARAVVQQARAVLADEPVAALDPVSARKVMELLRDLNHNDGLAVVVSLQGLDMATLSDIYGPEIQDVFWEGARA
jgi:phosphonate transport system ATP-binding protein